MQVTVVLPFFDEDYGNAQAVQMPLVHGPDAGRCDNDPIHALGVQHLNGRYLSFRFRV